MLCDLFPGTVCMYSHIIDTSVCHSYPPSACKKLNLVFSEPGVPKMPERYLCNKLKSCFAFDWGFLVSWLLNILVKEISFAVFAESNNNNASLNFTPPISKGNSTRLM